MKKTPIYIDFSEYPQEFHHILQNANLFDSSCSELAQVIYLDSGYYLKTAARGQLKREAEMTSIFYEKGFGVELVEYLSREKDYMLTRAAEGEDATHYLENPRQLCEVLAAAMRKLHSQHFCEASDIPEAQNLKDYRSSLKKQTAGNIDSKNIDNKNVDNKNIDTKDIDVKNIDEKCVDMKYLIKCFQIHSVEEMKQLMKSNYCKFSRDTLIHGDFCLPNVILNEGKFNTLIDFSMSGLGDKHIDLYWVIWSLSYNLKTEEYTEYFLDLYGRENFDFEMLRTVAAFEAFG